MCDNCTNEIDKFENNNEIAENEVEVLCHEQGNHEDEVIIEECEVSNSIPQAPTVKKRKRCAEFLVTKFEGLLMFALILVVIGICSFNLQKSIVDFSYDLSDQIAVLENQIEDMDHQIETLENKVDDLQLQLDAYIDGNSQPINVTVNVDGNSKDYIYDEESGELVESENENFDTRPFLGVGFFEGNDGSNNPIGIQIDYVYPYSPAEFAGIKAGDIIMAIDDNWIDTYTDLDAIMSQLAANDTINIRVATASETGVNIITVPATLTYRGNFDLGEE